jgi:hypothetical protein
MNPLAIDEIFLSDGSAKVFSLAAVWFPDGELQ